MDATFEQRRAVFNMYSALGWDVRGVHSMTKEEASAAIEKAQKEIDTKGFPKRNDKAASRGQTDAEYALSLTSIGGPFKKLSPAMEMWGRMLKCTGNRCWIEKVDESGAVGIYLEDGAIVEKKEEQPAAK